MSQRDDHIRFLSSFGDDCAGSFDGVGYSESRRRSGVCVSQTDECDAKRFALSRADFADDEFLRRDHSGLAQYVRRDQPFEGGLGIGLCKQRSDEREVVSREVERIDRELIEGFEHAGIFGNRVAAQFSVRGALIAQIIT